MVAELVADPGRLLVGVDPATRTAGTAPNGFECSPAAPSSAPVLLGLLGVGLLVVVGVLGGMRATGVPDRVRFPLLGCAVVLPVLAVLVTGWWSTWRASGCGPTRPVGC